MNNLFVNLYSFIDFFAAITASHYFLTFAIASFFILKAFLFFKIITHSGLSNLEKPIIFLTLILFSTLVIDLDWLLKSEKILFSIDSEIYFKLSLFLRRISWAFFILQYQFLALFIESLISPKLELKKRHFIFLGITSFLFIALLAIAFLNFNILSSEERSSFEISIIKLLYTYSLLPLVISSFIVVIRKLRKNLLPRILEKQMKLLLLVVVFPYWLSDFIQYLPILNLSIPVGWVNDNYSLLSISNLILIFAAYYCSRRIMGLRFLNFSNHVSAPMNINFMEDFKTILEQFTHVTKIQELHLICQGFFKESFSIPYNRTLLHVRHVSADYRDDVNVNRIVSHVETFMSTHTDKMCDYLKDQKVVIYDELAFTHFYHPTEQTQEILSFMESINADIFLPIYDKTKLIAYIVVDRFARVEEFYSDIERDEMIIFARYLGNIINLIQNKDLDRLLAQEKDLKEELYRKHQEINQYKESIRSFLRTNKEKKIGIIFYKNRRFTFGNQAAKELIKINPNQQDGHPLTKALKQVAHQVDTYKSAQQVFAKTTNGANLIFSGVPNLERNNIIITVYYPEIADIVKKQIDLLKDPSEWDYLLYLETTKPGKLINDLIPGSGEVLLQFKINLLKIALSKKAILLDVPDEDSMPTVELLHHVSLRKTLHVLDLKEPVKTMDTAIEIFGINPLFYNQKSVTPLLEKLDGNGTIFIKNIHLLDYESQEHLAEFIRYGYFRMIKSEQKIPSDVRIICSSTHQLHQLVQDGKFSKELYNELNRTHLTMPSLVTLPEDELNVLAEGYSDQSIKTKTLKNLLALTEKDKVKLRAQRPASLHEFKSAVHQLLVNKSKKTEIYEEGQFDPAYEISDPEISQAARLGKHALKDKRLLSLLWYKFKNQNKIAALLGVNRSSVNRRCKEYNLID